MPAVFAVVAAVATLVATRHGPALSPDSVTYISAARNLAAGHGFTDLTGQPNTTFAPGFSTLLAVAQWVGLSALSGARLINAVSFAGAVILTWVLLRRHVASRRLVLGATALAAISPALLNVSSHAWSEPLFCVVVLGFVLVLECALNSTSHPTGLIALAGFLAGLGVLVRYAAAALAVTGVLVLLVSRVGRPVRTRLAQVGVFTLAVVPLPALWLIRNASSGAPYLLGPRVAVSESLWGLLRPFANGLGELVVPTGTISFWEVAVLEGAALMAMVAVAVAWHRLRAEHATSANTLVALSGLIAVYSVFVLVAGKLSGASVEARTIMPIYLPLLILTASLVERAQAVARSHRTRWRLPPRRVGLVLAIALLGLYGGWFVQAVVQDGTVGRYASPSVIGSPLAEAVEHLPSGEPVVSNAPWALYYASGHQPVLPQPGPLVPAASLIPPTVDQLVDALCSRPVYVAWYSRRGVAVPASKFPTLALHPVHTVSDGTLYALSADTPCAGGAAHPPPNAVAAMPPILAPLAATTSDAHNS